MVNTAQLPLFSAVRDNQPAPPPPQPQPPAPQPDPEPQIDFSKIDCPYKAVLLPTINPAIVATTLTGLIAASMTGAPCQAALAMAMGNTPGELTYSFDPNDANAVVKGTGTLGEAAYTENWAVNQETGAITVSGTIGESTQELTFTQDEEQNCMFINGHVGDLAVSQKLFVVESETGDDSRSRLVIDGTIGGRAYHQELTVDGQDDQGSLIGSSGYINGSDLNQAWVASSTPTGQNTMAVGDVAGVQFTLNADLIQAQP